MNTHLHPIFRPILNSFAGAQRQYDQQEPQEIELEPWGVEDVRMSNFHDQCIAKLIAEDTINHAQKLRK